MSILKLKKQPQFQDEQMINKYLMKKLMVIKLLKRRDYLRKNAQYISIV